MAESAIVADILRHLHSEYGSAWYGFKVHGDVYTVGQPDIVGCLNGRALVIECKRPGQHSRQVQRTVQKRWAQAGALVIADATCWQDVAKMLLTSAIRPVIMLM